jgi:hypothetical protein
MYQPGACRFAHRFAAPGTFGYVLSPIPASLATHHGEPPAQAVIVAAGNDDGDEGGRGQRQHHITVSMTGGQLRARPAELRITAGDLVVWSGDRTVTFGFAVRGGSGRS